MILIFCTIFLFGSFSKYTCFGLGMAVWAMRALPACPCPCTCTSLWIKRNPACFFAACIRYLEIKAELDTIRLTYARMQAQLEETHKLLHEEHKKRFKLEDEISRLNLELARMKDLEDRLGMERCVHVCIRALACARLCMHAELSE